MNKDINNEDGNNVDRNNGDGNNEDGDGDNELQKELEARWKITPEQCINPSPENKEHCDCFNSIQGIITAAEQREKSEADKKETRDIIQRRISLLRARREWLITNTNNVADRRWTTCLVNATNNEDDDGIEWGQRSKCCMEDNITDYRSVKNCTFGHVERHCLGKPVPDLPGSRNFKQFGLGTTEAKRPEVVGGGGGEWMWQQMDAETDPAGTSADYKDFVITSDTYLEKDLDGNGVPNDGAPTQLRVLEGGEGAEGSSATIDEKNKPKKFPCKSSDSWNKRDGILKDDQDGEQGETPEECYNYLKNNAPWLAHNYYMCNKKTGGYAGPSGNTGRLIDAEKRWIGADSLDSRCPIGTNTIEFFDSDFKLANSSSNSEKMPGTSIDDLHQHGGIKDYINVAIGDPPTTLFNEIRSGEKPGGIVGGGGQNSKRRGGWNNPTVCGRNRDDRSDWDDNPCNLQCSFQDEKIKEKKEDWENSEVIANIDREITQYTQDFNANLSNPVTMKNYIACCEISFDGGNLKTAKEVTQECTVENNDVNNISPEQLDKIKKDITDGLKKNPSRQLQEKEPSFWEGEGNIEMVLWIVFGCFCATLIYLIFKKLLNN